MDKSYIVEEIEVALKHIGSLKAPGSDGFPALFYQKYWKIVGKDISEVVLDIFNNRRDISFLNYTLIALIPKFKSPEDFS